MVVGFRFGDLGFGALKLLDLLLRGLKFVCFGLFVYFRSLKFVDLKNENLKNVGI